MAIQALPSTAVHAIGANQTLTDPCALVKELVDNALDARATSIAVEIHANTLDLVQVRDNGHGIPPQDRPLVARRYCTSKITGMDDLKSIGGSSLGFRGEALASAAELSGSLTITTRVEGEQVATALKIDQQGEVNGQERASTAIGTTVKATDFVKANPVRKQVLLKHADQCLRKIKTQLQSFAFARPNVRLSLRVLKAKNDKSNWTYAPKVGGHAEDAAFKIVGAACASQCVWSVIELHGYTLQAFLPKLDAIGSKIANVGCFLSVDGRPLSTARSMPKQVQKIFRKTLKSAKHDMENVNDPFLYLAIACPEESYDANVEPAKDDVLFEDASKVIEAVRQLFSVVYPISEETRVSRQATNQRSDPKIDAPAAWDDDNEDFTTSLEVQSTKEPAHHARGAASKAQMTPRPNAFDEQIPSVFEERADSPAENDSEPSDERQARQAFRFNMYGCDEDDVLQLDDSAAMDTTANDLEELRQAHNDKTASNPWVMAKLNASIQTQKLSRQSPIESLNSVEPARTKQVTTPSEVTNSRTPMLPTPRPSSPSDDRHPFHPSDRVQDIRLASDGRVIGPSSLPSGQRYAASPLLASGWEASSPSHRQTRQTYNYDVAPPPEEVQGTPLSATPKARPIRQAAPNRPFMSPMVDRPPREKVWFDHIESIEDRRRKRQPVHHSQSEGLVQRGELSDLAEDARILTPPRRNRNIRDFVDSRDLTVNPTAPPRRQNAPPAVMQQVPPRTSDVNALRRYGALSGRGFVPASELAAVEVRFGTPDKPAAPPPKRRKTGERALSQISGNAPPQPAPATDEEEEYRPETASKGLSRRESSSNLHRSKSARLPLERVPAGQGTHNLVVKTTLSAASITAQEQRMNLSASLLLWNEPALDTYDVFSQQQDPHDVHCITQKLHELLINKVSDGEMVQDLGTLVQAALTSNADMRAAEAMEESEADSLLEPTQSTQDCILPI